MGTFGAEHAEQSTQTAETEHVATFVDDHTELRVVDADSDYDETLADADMVAIRPYIGNTYCSTYDHPEHQDLVTYYEDGGFPHFYVLGGRYSEADFAGELRDMQETAETAITDGRIEYSTRLANGRKRCDEPEKQIADFLNADRGQQFVIAAVFRSDIAADVIDALDAAYCRERSLQ